MTTQKQLLESEGEELSQALGEVLQPEKKCKYCWHFDKPSCNYGLGNCKHKDGRGMTDCEQVPCEYYYKKPIPLDDWNVAMKWRDWAVEKFGGESFHQAMWDVCCSLSEHGANTAFSYWLTVHVIASHYLKAAALCEIRSKE